MTAFSNQQLARNGSLRVSRTVSLVRFLAIGIASALAIGLTAGPGLGVAVGLAVGLAFALASAIVDNRNWGGNPWLTYQIALCWLAGRRRLPYRLLSFLDDAHRLGLLRAVGPVYQFRHAEFHDHLAARFDLRSSS